MSVTTVRILLVEDNEDEAFLLIHELKRAGYEVISRRVDTPEAMREALSADTWDVITSDHKMPRFSAPEALRLARDVAPDLPVIIVSGEIDLDLAVSLLKDGALDYVQKDKLPLAVPSIANALEIINRRRSQVYTEEEVRTLSERLLLATSSSGIGIWEYDPVTKETFWDQTIYNIFGYSERPKEKPDELFKIHVAKDDYERLLGYFEVMLTEGKSYHSEFKIITKDNQTRYVKVSTYVDKDTQGNVVRIIGTNLDITDLRMAIESQRSVESSFEALFFNSKDAIIIIDAEGPNIGHIVSANPAAAKMHGYAPGELTGVSVKDLNTSESAALVEGRISKTLSERQVSFEAVHIRRDGSQFRIEVTAAAIHAGGRKLILAIEHEIDVKKQESPSEIFLSERLELLAQITSNVLGESSLKQQAEKLCADVQRTFGADACIIRLIDKEDLRILASAGIAESSLSKTLPINYGLGKDVLSEGRAISVANIPESPYAVYLTDEKRPATQDRRFNFVSYAGAPIRVQNQLLGIIAIYSEKQLRDFTDTDLNHLQIAANHIAVSIENARLYDDIQKQKQELEDEIRVRRETEDQLRHKELELEERVKQRTAQLEEANKELEAFSYSVSHDLRSPIRAIQGFSTLLMKEYEHVLNEDGLDSLNRVIAASRKLNDLIDSMLSLSRIAREELHITSVNLSDIAQDVFFELKARHADRKVDVVVQPKMIARCDPRLIHIALTNLLDNAWKFTQNNPEAKIECGLKKVNGVDCFYVQDNGAGFDMTHAGRLFAPFQRLHNDSEFEGTGVGLAIVQRVVQRHGGKIWAESKVNVGTTFSFTLAPER